MHGASLMGVGFIHVHEDVLYVRVFMLRTIPYIRCICVCQGLCVLVASPDRDGPLDSCTTQFATTQWWAI